MPSAVVFDLDGTLVDTVPTRIAAWTTALAEHGVAARRSVLAAMIGADGRRVAREVAEDAGVPMRITRAAAVDARHGELYERLNTDPAPLAGVAELLAALQRANVPWAIATSSGNSRQVTASVAALRLGSAPLVVDGSHVEHAKPAPDLFLLAGQRLGLTSTERCWCVGDATWDMTAAVAAGMVPIGVTAGSAVDGRQLRAAGAILVVPTLADLLPLPSSG